MGQTDKSPSPPEPQGQGQGCGQTGWGGFLGAGWGQVTGEWAWLSRALLLLLEKRSSSSLAPPTLCVLYLKWLRAGGGVGHNINRVNIGTKVSDIQG